MFSDDEKKDVEFLFNIETITAYNNLDSMLGLASGNPGCNGVVFGRVDFSGSLGLGRDGIESEKVTTYVEHVARECRDKNLDFVVGGAVSIDALSNLIRFSSVKLDRFETRKVIFAGSALNNPELSLALRQAVHFELLWLINKREYYGVMHREDQFRIDMLESRWRILSGS